MSEVFDDGIVSDFFLTLPDKDFVDVVRRLLSKENLGIVNGIMTCYFGENFNETDFVTWPEDESARPFVGVRFGRWIPGGDYEFTQISYDGLVCYLLICCRMFVEAYPERSVEVDAMLESYQLRL